MKALKLSNPTEIPLFTLEENNVNNRQFHQIKFVQLLKFTVPRPEHPKLSVAAPPQIFNPATNPTPSVITRLLQPQQRPAPGPFSQGNFENNL